MWVLGWRPNHPYHCIPWARKGVFWSLWVSLNCDINMFATAENRLFPKHWEGSSDSNGAFNMSWGVCHLGFIHAPSKYMPKVVDKVISDAGRAIVVYVAGRRKVSSVKKLGLVTLEEYRVPKSSPGLMSDSGVQIATPQTEDCTCRRVVVSQSGDVTKEHSQSRRSYVGHWQPRH